MNEIIQSQVSLLSKNTWGINSIAEYFAEINNKSDLITAINFAKDRNLNIKILGLGSNILLPSSGIKGLVLQVKFNLFMVNNNKITLGAGNLLFNLIQNLAKLNIDLSSLAGLPSTIGGAIYGNAGALGLHLSDFLEEAEIINLNNSQTTIWQTNDFAFDYRYSKLKECPQQLFWSGVFNFSALKKGQTSEQISENIVNTIKNRLDKQAKGKTAGCTFKNPINSHNWSAGYLIEQSGLKGFKIGDAKISEQHANFFINEGQATSDDFLALINLSKKLVKEKFNIDLDLEVQIW